MLLKDISFASPAENIVFDEILLLQSEAGHQEEVLRFWESQSTFVVLGKIGKVDDDVYVDRALKSNIPVLRRSSGGGTVVQGKGCLNFSCILSKHSHPDIADLRKSYRYILEKVIKALSSLGVESTFRPISDLALSDTDKKFSGNAQRRAKNFILHHGTILYDFDLALIEKFLKFPKDIPEYRKGRPHHDFVSNIDRGSLEIKAALKKAFGVREEVFQIEEGEFLRMQRYLQTHNPILDLGNLF